MIYSIERSYSVRLALAGWIKLLENLTTSIAGVHRGSGPASVAYILSNVAFAVHFSRFLAEGSSNAKGEVLWRQSVKAKQEGGTVARDTTDARRYLLDLDLLLPNGLTRVTGVQSIRDSVNVNIAWAQSL